MKRLTPAHVRRYRSGSTDRSLIGRPVKLSRISLPLPARALAGRKFERLLLLIVLVSILVLLIPNALAAWGALTRGRGQATTHTRAL